MKILLVLNHFLPEQTAGTEVYTWALAKEMMGRKNEVGAKVKAEVEEKVEVEGMGAVEVRVVIPNYGKDTAERYVYDGITVIKYAEPSVADRSLIMGRRKPDGLVSFEALLNEEKPDIVHFQELAGSRGITLHHVLAAKQYGAKVLMTFHLAGYSCATGNLVYKGKELCDGFIDIARCSECYLCKKSGYVMGELLSKSGMLFYKSGIDTSQWDTKIGTALGSSFILRRLQADLFTLVDFCDKVVVLTNWYKKVLIKNGIAPSKIVLIQQGLPSKVSLLPALRKKANEKIKLVFLGRISPFKGLHLLLEALRLLPQEKIELDIYGQSVDGLYESKCKKLSARNRNILWKGKLAQPEVVQTLVKYDALCLCSTFSEMSPLVIQEAFAAGIPVIASNVYGNAEQIQHNHNGLLFTFNKVNSLREQLNRCINDPDLLAFLRKHINAPRTFDSVAEEYKVLYQTLIC